MSHKKHERATEWIRSHFGSSHCLLERARCFSRSPALLVLSCPSVYNQFVVSHLFLWHVRPTEQMCRYLQHKPLLRIWFLLAVRSLALMGQDFAPVRWRRKSTKYAHDSQIAADSIIAPRRFAKQWLRMQRPSPVALARPDLGILSDIVTGPQPLGLSGPMVQGHLMTVEIRDVDLILSKIDKHEVPSYYGSLKKTLGLRFGSISLKKRPACRRVTNL